MLFQITNDIIKKVKKTTNRMKGYILNHISDKDLISWIYFLNSTTKKDKQSNLKIDKGLKSIFLWTDT